MANTIKEQRLVDNNKRSLLKYVIIADGTTQETGTTLVDVSTLAFALNTSGQIMTDQTNVKPKYNTTIKRLWGNFTGAGYAKLDWHGTGNTDIAVFGSGRIDIDFERRGDPAVIPNAATSSNGDILITTSGLASGTVCTLFVDLRKDNADYDAGQTADPTAFNIGPAQFR